MFNPPPADLSDREPLFHVTSTTEFWYRSHRVGNSPTFLIRPERIGGTRPTVISASSIWAEMNIVPSWSPLVAAR
jgi:hypothetical protein